jgi:hypothetical protein
LEGIHYPSTSSALLWPLVCVCEFVLFLCLYVKKKKKEKTKHMYVINIDKRYYKLHLINTEDLKKECTSFSDGTASSII